jgi:hypothetical protein
LEQAERQTHHHPTPKAWLFCFWLRFSLRLVDVLGGASGKAIESAPEVLEVVIADLEFLHFVDDGLEVR